MKSTFPELRTLAEITRGVHSYRLGGYGQTAFGKGVQTKRDLEEHPYHSKIKLNGYRPFIYGKDLRRFTPPIGIEFIKYGEWLAEPRRPDFFEGERVYSRKILGERLLVTVEVSNSVADQQVYITKPKNSSKMKAHFLASLLGSRLMSFFIRKYFDESEDAFPQIKVGQLQSLPIYDINFNDKEERARHDRMVQLVEQMLEAKKQLTNVSNERDQSFYENKCAALDRQIDKLVYELYELTDDEIAIIEES